MLYNHLMGWWLGENDDEYVGKEPHLKCSACGETHEVSSKYINSLTDEMVNICYDCHKKKYLEGLAVISAIDEFTDI